jgi:hypothetical protein
MALTYIHQSQLRRLVKAHNPEIVSNHDQDFTEWMEQNVGVFTQDWGRIYYLDQAQSTYGTTWWVLDPAKATLTLLRWS